MRNFIDETRIYFSVFSKDLSNNKSVYLKKFCLLWIGLTLFSLAIALYVPTAVGVSHIDYSVYSILLSLNKGYVGQNGALTGIGAANYSQYLTYYYLGMTVLSFTFAIIAAMKRFKLSNKANYYVWVKPIIILSVDIIMVFVLPLYIKLFQETLGINNALFAPNIQSSPAIRSWIFLASFVCYIIGIATWVYSGWMGGAYNSLCSNWMDMTNMKFSKSRIVMDALLFIPGLIITAILFGTMSDFPIANFMLVNINWGSVVFVLLTGPLLGLFIQKVLVKFISLEKKPIEKMNSKFYQAFQPLVLPIIEKE